MKQSDFDTFKAELTRLSHLLPKTISDEIIQAYWQHLETFWLESFQLACKKAVNEFDKFPTVSQMRKLCIESIKANKVVYTKELVDDRTPEEKLSAHAAMLVFQEDWGDAAATAKTLEIRKGRSLEQIETEIWKRTNQIKQQIRETFCHD